MAGSGDEEAYRALAARCGVAARVHWLGVTPEIQTVYEASDAFVLPVELRDVFAGRLRGGSERDPGPSDARSTACASSSATDAPVS